MPIEIRELVIRATVENGKEGAQKPAGTPSKEAATPANADNDQVVQACVEQVLEILRRKQER